MNGLFIAPHYRFAASPACGTPDSAQRGTSGLFCVAERGRIPYFLCKASRPTLYKNMNDGMSLCDRAGLYSGVAEKTGMTFPLNFSPERNKK